MQKITPFLWMDTQAEEAASFYVSVFKNSKLGTVTHYGKGAPMPEGTVMTASFELQGQEFVALNGGPVFNFTPAISFSVDCETQDEVDEYWEKLSAQPEAEQCGWLQDKYGVSWQIIPRALPEMLQDPDPEKARRVMDAMMQMKKIDVKILQGAYDGS